MKMHQSQFIAEQHPDFRNEHEVEDSMWADIRTSNPPKEPKGARVGFTRPTIPLSAETTPPPPGPNHGHQVAV